MTDLLHNGHEGANNSSIYTQTNSLTANEERLYRQSIYIACFDRYFGLRGFVCYAEQSFGSKWDFAFRHVASGKAILVFSHLDEQVFNTYDKMPRGTQVIIDSSSLDVPFTECEYCHGGYYVSEQIYQEAQECEFCILIKDSLLEGFNDSETTRCCDCWGVMNHHLINKMLRDLYEIRWEEREGFKHSVSEAQL